MAELAPWLLAGVVFLGFLVESAAGFGSTLIALSLGAHLMPLPAVMAVVVPINLLLSASLAWQDRAHLQLRLLATRVLPPMLLGMALGIGVLGATGDRGLKLAFALFVTGLAAVELWRLRRGGSSSQEPLAPWVERSWLFGAGVAHGVFAASGPLVVFAFSRALPDKRAFRGTLAVLWLLLNLVLVASFVARGALDGGSLKLAAWMLVPLLLGMRAGDAIHRRIDAGAFRGMVFGLVGLAGLTLVAGALREG